MKTFKTEIVTPEGRAFEGNSASVVMPGVQGSFEVRHNHASLISLLEIGMVRIADEQEKEHEYAISGGFVEVSNNQVILMAETAERSDEIDLERAREARKRAEERLRKKNVEHARAELALRRAINRIKVAGT